MSNYTVILSASRAELSSCENYSRSVVMSKEIKALGLSSVDALGVYNGTKEASFAIPCQNLNEVSELYSAADYYNQDCILVIDNRTQLCYFISNYDELTMLNVGIQPSAGTWYKSSNTHPVGDHTYFPQANASYIIL